MGTLFLSGGGNARQTSRLDGIFAKTIKKHKRLLYIPIAMPESEHTFGACFDWIRKALGPHDISKIDMWVDLAGRSQTELDRYGAVYIGGGNAYHLLDAIRGSGFDRLLLGYLRSGGIVYGGSAGAIILGKDIGTTSDRNLTGTGNLRGLNVVNGYSVRCHYTTKDDGELRNYVKRKRIGVLALPENSGIVLDKGAIRSVGVVYEFTIRGSGVEKRRV